MDAFAQACENVARQSSRLKKVAVLAAYLRELSDADLPRAIRFLTGSPVYAAPANLTLFETTEPAKLSIGYAPIRDALIRASGWDAAMVHICAREVGDGGETVGLLLAPVSRGEPFTLAEAEQIYLKLHATRRAATRVEILTDCFLRYRGPALKYFVKAMGGGFRIGLQEKILEEAVAAAAGQPAAAIRDANNRLGDLAEVALAARHNTLESIEARLFHPMDFMLARPLDQVSDLPDPANFWIEDKYDGIRTQAHTDQGRAQIYTRNRDEVTRSYPELAAALARINRPAILDGEILAWRDGRALAFSVLQQRIARKKLSQSLIEGIPLVFMAYDLTFLDGKLLLDQPIEKRRALLAQTIHDVSPRILLSPQWPGESHEHLNLLFDRAREHGNEGLLLKRRESLYEPGRRGGAWLKVKRAFASLDVVITAAEQGHGKRALVLSDYTFAVRAGDEFWNIGKAYSGLTDEEIRTMTRRLRAATVERFGRVLLVRPEFVLEVAFDGIQKSPRHKSGYALRFPRIVRLRPDKLPADIDTIDRVRELYESTLNLTAARDL